MGRLAHEVLADAPSSEVSLEEVCPDPREFGAQLLGGLASVFIMESTSDGFLGAARVVPREFIRASHVAEVTLGVRPDARQQGIGRAMLNALEREFREAAGFGKAVVRVAGDDRGLAQLLQRSESPWSVERCEHQALFRDHRYIDMLLYAFHIPCDPKTMVQ